MKMTILAVAAIASLSTAAYAGDTTVSLSYGSTFAPDGFSESLTNPTEIAITHDFGAVTAGLAYGTDDTVKTLEATAGADYALADGVDLHGALGIGQTVDSNDFAYYAVYGGADVKINDKLSWDAVEYRYRNAFDTANNFESHRLATGLTYAVNDKVDLNGTVYRDFDGNFDATNNGVEVGVAYKF